jgi:hypothetical protein
MAFMLEAVMQRKKRLGAAAMSAVILLALATVATGQRALAEPAGCAGPEGYGPWVSTQASFSQRVGLNTCADKFQLGARVEFSPTSAFNASHIRGCSMHVGLVSETEPSWKFPEITRDCTAAARLGVPFSMNTATTWHIPSQPEDIGARFHITGYINIQTGVYYGTYPYASRYGFEHCLRAC